MVIKTKIHSSIKSIAPNDWQQITDPNSPFFDYEFLEALEDGNCLGEQTGWIPQYVTFLENNTLVGAIPFYKKNHSYGEFIFDFQFAQAYRQHGLKYYPKLVAAIPVTPATSNKILLGPGKSFSDIVGPLNTLLSDKVDQDSLSSVHFLYCRDHEADDLKLDGFIKRFTFEFHWHNQNYKTFDDFLKNLNHKRRSQVRKERKQAQSSDLKILRLVGDDIKEEHIKAAFQFYVLHHHMKYGSPIYLTEDFFFEAWQKMKDRMLLIMIKRDNQYVGGSINFFKNKGLFGRYWGHIDHLPFMHFEACYYQQIEFAIEHNISVFEAGAQGDHKIKRGLIPQYTYSAHKFAHPEFHKAIENHLQKERQAKEEEMAYFTARSPYRES